MKIVKKFFTLAALITFGSNCFGAKEIKFEQIGYTVSFRNDGQVIYVNDNNGEETIGLIHHSKDVAQEVFKITENPEHEGCFIVFPMGIYKFRDLDESRKICDLQIKFNKDLCRKVGKYSFIALNNILLFAKEGDKVISKDTMDFEIGSFIASEESLVVYGKNFNKDGAHKVIALS